MRFRELFIAGSLLVVLNGAGAAQTAGSWTSTPWPSVTPGGRELCFLAYNDAGTSLSVAKQVPGTPFIGIVDPSLASTAEGTVLRLVFPSGWSVSGPGKKTKNGLLLNMDDRYFERILSELENVGVLKAIAGPSVVNIPVTSDVKGRIGNLRGPLPPGAPMKQPCIRQFRQGL
jgi:hypothetical protein